jgi:DNA-binding winged helix-turn-helix (wHTH) protein/Tol biopolymer transport system component
MPMPTASLNGTQVIRFGIFEVDLRAGELRRNGSRVKLQEQPFQVLAALLDRPGEVVTRDELQKRLWPADTFVDFDHSLNAAIRRLREALGDSAENPRFVETVARRGYRFIGPVNGRAPAVDLQKPEGASRYLRKRLWAGGAVLVMLLVMGIGIGFRLGSRAPQFTPPIERRLTANPEEAQVTGAAISPDGKYLAFSDKNGCYLRQIDTGETHSIPLPPGFNPSPASWFPDGLHLLATWVEGPHEPTSIWMISIMGGQPRKLANQGRWPAVSPDGSQIVFAEHSEAGWLTPEGSQSLWVMQADGERPRKIVEIKGIDFGSAFGPPAWAPDGKRIAFVRSKYHPGNVDSDSQIEIFNLNSGKTEVALRSPRLMDAVTWTNDARLIYSLPEARPMPNDSNLWAIHIDERNNRTFGDAARLTTDSGYVSSISLSAKGDRLAIVRQTLQPDVYVSNLQDRGRALSPPRRFTLDERDDYPFAWTPDDKSVLFVSNRDGTYHIFKQAVDQTAPELLLGGEQQLFVPRLSPDANSILYFITPKMGTASTRVRLMRMSLGGGPPQEITQRDGINNHQCARSPATLCLFSTIDQTRESFFRFDPAGGATQEIPQLAIESIDYSTKNWSLSPDGATLATASKQLAHAGKNSEVPAVKLTSLNGFTSRIIPVPNWTSLSSLDWAADGRSLWAAAHNTNNASALLKIDLNGHIYPLLQEDKMKLGWAIESLDGGRLAFWKASGNSNVWMLEKF